MEIYLYEDLYRQEDRHWWHAAKRQAVLKLAGKYLKCKKPLILDVGCGTGKNAETFSKIGDCWGVDSAAEAIKFCQKRKSAKFKLAPADKTGFAPETFNLVSALDVLEHTDDRKVVAEAHRILKKDGLLIITVPAYSWLWSKWDTVLHHRRRYNKGSLQDLLNSGGFKVLKISYLYSFLLLPVLIIRALKSLFLQNKYGSDFNLNSPLINSVAGTLSRLEVNVLGKYDIPVGTSLICAARKQ